MFAQIYLVSFALLSFAFHLCRILFCCFRYVLLFFVCPVSCITIFMTIGVNLIKLLWCRVYTLQNTLGCCTPIMEFMVWYWDDTLTSDVMCILLFRLFYYTFFFFSLKISFIFFRPPFYWIDEPNYTVIVDWMLHVFFPKFSLLLQNSLSRFFPLLQCYDCISKVHINF